MSKLFVEIYLDENVHVLIAKIIQSHGFKAVTTQDVGRKGASDPEQLEYATELVLCNLNICTWGTLASCRQ